MIQLETSPSDAGQRLDTYLHARRAEYSRARLQDWIKSGRVRINGSPEKRSYLLKGAERIHVTRRTAAAAGHGGRPAYRDPV